MPAGNSGMVLREVPVRFRSDVHQPDVGRATAACGHERQRPAVGRQGALVVEGRIIRQPLDTRTVRVHSVDVGQPVPLARIHDPPAVRGIARRILEAARRQERSFVLAVGIRHEQRQRGRLEMVEEHAVFRCRSLSFGRRRAERSPDERRRQSAGEKLPGRHRRLLTSGSESEPG
jgi:hypothetical protein